MVKRRLAVTVSPKLKRRGDLVTVVPLSTTEPIPLCDWHLPLDINVPGYWGHVPRWAKCDMLATVGFHRLDLPYEKNLLTNGRKYVQIELPAEALAAIHQGISHALGMG